MTMSQTTTADNFGEVFLHKTDDMNVTTVDENGDLASQEYGAGSHTIVNIGQYSSNAKDNKNQNRIRTNLDRSDELVQMRYKVSEQPDCKKGDDKCNGDGDPDGDLDGVKAAENTYYEYRYANFLQSSSKKKLQIGTEFGITDQEVELAATLINDAMEGRKVDIKTESKYVRSYTIYKYPVLRYILYLCLFVNMALVLFEEPTVEYLRLNYWVTMLVEVICLLYFALRTCHHAHWRSFRNFMKDIKNVFVIVFICVTVIDMIVYIVCRECYPGTYAIRFSRPLRPFYIVNFSDGKQIRRAWRNIRRTVIEIYHVLLLFLGMVLVFGLIGNQLFTPLTDIKFPNGDPYFQNYFDCVWMLTVLVTTANNPDVMLPALKKSGWFCLYFFSYIIVSYYILLNVFLAIAYHSYNENMKEEIKSSSKAKKKKLIQAFNVIKINIRGEDMVTYKIWKKLMTLVKPKLNHKQVDLLMLILDNNRSGYICKKEFLNVADLLNLPVSEIADRTTWLEAHYPDIYNSIISELIKTTVQSICFKLIMDGLVLVQVVLIGFNIDDLVPSVIFCIIFSIEILLKLYTCGPVKFAKSFHNWMNTIVTAVSIICLAIEYLIPSNCIVERVTDIFSITRIFRCIRLLRHIKRFRIILETLVHICQSIFMYCGVILIMYYTFAIIGLELFNGVISTTNATNCGNVRLSGTSFAESGYCLLNFNDIYSATMLLATLLYENNWHVIAEGYSVVTSKYARIYFGSFYVSVVIVLMNIITAFVVDMFMNEFALQKEGKETSPIEEKIQKLGLGIDADTGLQVSAPLTDGELLEIMRGDTLKPRQELKHNRNTIMEITKGRKLSSVLRARRVTEVPQLSRFDGIRFHIKKSGMRQLEVLLQQMYDVDDDEGDSGSEMF